MAIKKRSKTTHVNGGMVKREAATGRFIEVVSYKGAAAKASSKTLTTVREASSKRSSALKRLADR